MKRQIENKLIEWKNKKRACLSRLLIRQFQVNLVGL